MFDWVLNLPLYYLFAKHIECQQTDLQSHFSVKLCATLPQQIHNPTGQVGVQSNTSQVIEPNSSACNFWDTVIAFVIGLFHGICFFHSRNSECLAAFCFSGQPIFVNLVDMYNTKKITKTSIYIQKEHIKTYSFFEKVWLFFSFIEELAFKHFLFMNMTIPRFFLFFSDHADIKMSHT